MVLIWHKSIVWSHGVLFGSVGLHSFGNTHNVLALQKVT